MVHMYVCVYIYIYIFIYLFIYTYVQTHTLSHYPVSGLAKLWNQVLRVAPWLCAVWQRSDMQEGGTTCSELCKKSRGLLHLSNDFGQKVVTFSLGAPSMGLDYGMAFIV